jgi:hypothetical protein
MKQSLTNLIFSSTLFIILVFVAFICSFIGSACAKSYSQYDNVEIYITDISYR